MPSSTGPRNLPSNSTLSLSPDPSTHDSLNIIEAPPIRTSDGSGDVDDKQSSLADEKRPAHAMAEATATPAEPYTLWSPLARRAIVVMACMTAFTSPFAVNVFVPSLPDIVDRLHITATEATLLITIFSVFQGLSPVVWSPLADTLGRRPITLAMFLVFIGASLGLGFVEAYWALMLLRVVQACGASAAVSVGSGTIADITDRSRRGSVMGWFGLAQYAAVAIGPVFGGALALAPRLGFQAIFFFLAAFGALVFILVLCFMPETLRSLVGNGSKQATGLHRPLVPILVAPAGSQPMTSPWGSHVSFNLTAPIRALLQVDVLCIIISYSLIYWGWYLSLASLATLLDEHYGLSEIEIGLCFLPNGLGCMAGTVLSGRLLDLGYARARHSSTASGRPLRIHRVRLGSALFVYLPGFCLSLLAYGWSIGRTHLAAPMVFQFTLGAFTCLSFTCSTTLLVDLFPGKAASATSALNLGRCTFAGAIGSGIIQPLLGSRLGTGGTFSMGAGVVFAGSLACFAVVWRYGEDVIQARKAKEGD